MIKERKSTSTTGQARRVPTSCSLANSGIRSRVFESSLIIFNQPQSQRAGETNNVVSRWLAKDWQRHTGSGQLRSQTSVTSCAADWQPQIDLKLADERPDSNVHKASQSQGRAKRKAQREGLAELVWANAFIIIIIIIIRMAILILASIGELEVAKIGVCRQKSIGLSPFVWPSSSSPIGQFVHFSQSRQSIDPRGLATGTRACYWAS